MYAVPGTTVTCSTSGRMSLVVSAAVLSVLVSENVPRRERHLLAITAPGSCSCAMPRTQSVTGAAAHVLLQCLSSRVSWCHGRLRTFSRKRAASRHPCTIRVLWAAITLQAAK